MFESPPLPRPAISLGPALGLLAIPEIANAATDTFTIYAYGSGNVLRQIFEGMKGFVDDPNYRMLILLLLLLTMIFSLVRGFIFNRPSPMPIVSLILLAMGVQIGLYSDSARAPVHIEDQVHGEDYLVDDMPLALVGAAALTSEISRYMVKLVEAFYMGPAIPSEMYISNTNTYNFSNKIAGALKNVSVSDVPQRRWIKAGSVFPSQSNVRKAAQSHSLRPHGRTFGITRALCIHAAYFLARAAHQKINLGRFAWRQSIARKTILDDTTSIYVNSRPDGGNVTKADA